LLLLLLLLLLLCVTPFTCCLTIWWPLLQQHFLLSVNFFSLRCNFFLPPGSSKRNNFKLLLQ
jgi:hypothetical protein